MCSATSLLKLLSAIHSLEGAGSLTACYRSVGGMSNDVDQLCFAASLLKLLSAILSLHGAGSLTPCNRSVGEINFSNDVELSIFFLDPVTDLSSQPGHNRLTFTRPRLNPCLGVEFPFQHPGYDLQNTPFQAHRLRSDMFQLPKALFLSIRSSSFICIRIPFSSEIFLPLHWTITRKRSMMKKQNNLDWEDRSGSLCFCGCFPVEECYADWDYVQKTSLSVIWVNKYRVLDAVSYGWQHMYHLPLFLGLEDQKSRKFQGQNYRSCGITLMKYSVWLFTYRLNNLSDLTGGPSIQDS